LQVLDQRVEEGDEYSPAFLMGALLAYPLLDVIEAEESRQQGRRPDYGRLAYRFLKPLTARLGIARHDTELLFLIAISQRRLVPCREGRPVPSFFINKPYYVEALELFLLDAEARGLELGQLQFAPRGRRRRARSRRRRSGPDA
jgi:hypothetical protein